jgi:hypothetical protein
MNARTLSMVLWYKSRARSSALSAAKAKALGLPLPH